MDLGQAFNISRFYIVYMNSLGSLYRSASLVICKDKDPLKERYGLEFLLTIIQDNVK